jgi:uncharacterized protein YjbI with pentapeptide repeats
MANPEHLAQLDQCSRDDWNHWRASQSVALDLSGANLHGKELPERNLREADLQHADLSGAILGDANLKDADLRGADLRRATFDNTNLSGASLREANLQGVDLSVAQRGLQTEQLAGADLTGARLPDELTKLYEKLENVNNISESARKLFLAVLAACLYSWLTIATTTDVNLITNRASSPLPIIQTSIPIVGFYWVAPLLLLCVYFYFHFYLQKLWEELGSLPAIFPDGRPLHAKIDPWLLNDLVRSHLPKLNVNRPFLSYLQLWISVLLAWWVVPITMFLFWGRYLRRHERAGTAFHVVLLVISLTAALSLYRLGTATLRGAKRKPFGWRGVTSRRGYQAATFAVAVGAMFAVVSWGTRWGVPSDAPILGIPLLLQVGERSSPERGRRSGTDQLTWVPRLMALVGYSPFADLRAADISQKKFAWSSNDNNLDSVTGAHLEGANLRYALASGAFLVGANLSVADLRGANLTGADLSDALLSSSVITDADLDGANLARANLLFSHLPSAYLHNADLSRANLTDTDLTSADLTDANLSFSKLRGAYLNGVDLRGANLGGANLWRADLSGADLGDANLTHCDFRGVWYVSPEAVKAAAHWQMAFYDLEMLEALGLPPDHNARIAKQKEIEELRQRKSSGEPAPEAAAPRRN